MYYGEAEAMMGTEQISLDLIMTVGEPSTWAGMCVCADGRKHEYVKDEGS